MRGATRPPAQVRSPARTWPIAVAFSVVLGAIVGDVGYGVVVLLVVLWLRRRYPLTRGVRVGTPLFLAGGACTLVFGVLYGEFLGGALGAHMGEGLMTLPAGAPYLPLNREVFVLPVLAVAGAAALVQIAMGLSQRGMWARGREGAHEGSTSSVGLAVRIAAVGLAGAVLASLVNGLATTHQGSVSATWLLLAVALHGTNPLAAMSHTEWGQPQA